MSNPFTHKTYKILFIFLSLDLLIILLHLLFGRFILFNLDFEANIPTIYQGLKLLIFAHLFALFIFRNEFKKFSWMVKFISIFAFLLTLFVALDEMAMIHENVPTFVMDFAPAQSIELNDTARESGYDGSIWVIYYLPIFMTAAGLFLLQLKSLYKHLKLWVLVFIFAITLLILVPVFETFSTSGSYSENYNTLITVEESAEILGMTLISFSYYKFLLVAGKYQEVKK